MLKRPALTIPLVLALASALAVSAAGAAATLAGSSNDRSGHGHHGHHGHHRHTLLGIAVSPLAPTIVAGTDQPFSATGTYSDATTADLSATVTWASSDAAATISASGLAHGVSAGTSTISATLGLVSDSTLLTVSPAPVTVTLLGDVQNLFFDSSGFVTGLILTVTPDSYTVVIDIFGGTSVVNLAGHPVTPGFIVPGDSVEVTGLLSGSTIVATKVVVQTFKDF